jgi:hypothetical protein
VIITNSRLILLKVLIINLFLLETTGFDFYSHSTIHYFFNEQITHSYALFDSLIILPRYGLLSSLYEFSSRLGLPLGYLALALIYPPVNVILNFIFKNKIFRTVRVKEMGLILFVCYLVLFYSGLSLSALYILAYIISNNKCFLFGTFFHPISIFISPILFFFIMKKREFFIYLILFFTFLLYCFLLTKYELQTAFKSEIIKLYIEKDVFFELLEYSYNQKSGQINLLLCFLLISFFFRNKAMSIFVAISKLSTFSICRIKHVNLMVFLFIFSFTIILTFKGRPNFYNSLFVSNDVIYISWFDFGDKDYMESFEKLNSIR